MRPESRGAGARPAYAGQMVGRAEGGHVAAGGGDEFGAQDRADAGEAGDHRGERMVAKPGLDERVDLGDLLIEAYHLPGEPGHHFGSQPLPGNGRVLGLSGFDGGAGQRSGVAGLPVAQPGLDASRARAADCRRGLVAGQQDQGGFARAVVEGAFQCREDLQELRAEPVDLPGPVSDQVAAAGGKDPQVDGDLIARPQQAQVAAHAGLVGDDERVPRVGFPFATVGSRRPMDGQAGQVRHHLPCPASTATRSDAPP